MIQAIFHVPIPSRWVPVFCRKELGSQGEARRRCIIPPGFSVPFSQPALGRINRGFHDGERTSAGRANRWRMRDWRPSTTRLSPYHQRRPRFRTVIFGSRVLIFLGIGAFFLHNLLTLNLTTQGRLFFVGMVGLSLFMAAVYLMLLRLARKPLLAIDEMGIEIMGRQLTWEKIETCHWASQLRQMLFIKSISHKRPYLSRSPRTTVPRSRQRCAVSASGKIDRAAANS